MNTMYHYTECGLDNVFLVNGFEYKSLSSGRHVVIRDIDGLHREIGKALIENKKNLTGKELKFLRKEMLLSQSSLAKLLEVAEQTVHRWENGKADIPKPAESLIRFLYLDYLNDKSPLRIKELLARIADLEDEADAKMYSEMEDGWDVRTREAA